MDVLGIELHVVPVVNGNTSVGLFQMVEPQGREVERVPGLDPDPCGIRILSVILVLTGLRQGWIYCDPGDGIHAFYHFSFQFPGLFVALVHAGFEVFVPHPRKVGGRVQDDVLVTTDDAVDVLVRVFVRWKQERKKKLYIHIGLSDVERVTIRVDLSQRFAGFRLNTL